MIGSLMTRFAAGTALAATALLTGAVAHASTPAAADGPAATVTAPRWGDTTELTRWPTPCYPRHGGDGMASPAVCWPTPPCPIGGGRRVWCPAPPHPEWPFPTVPVF